MGISIPMHADAARMARDQASDAKGVIKSAFRPVLRAWRTPMLEASSGDRVVWSAAAGVAKWLRQRLVAPPFGGSNPLARPDQSLQGR